MMRIEHGITMNGKVLSKAARTIGDNDIPITSNWYTSLTFWIACILIILGVTCTVSGCIIKGNY